MSALLLTVALLLPPTARGSEPAAALEYFTLDLAFGFLPVHVLRFDPARFELAVLLPEEGLGSLARVPDMPGCAQAAACFNGSFFLESGRPLGLLVSEGKVLQEVRNVSWGIFWVDDRNRPHLTRRSEFKSSVDLADVQFALQSGPSLVLAGKRQQVKDSLHRRTAMGIDALGRVVVLVSPVPITFETLTDAARSKLSVTDLVNLDGGGSTQLVVNDPEDPVTVPGDTVAVGVAVRRRTSEAR
jgi:uncharacterized protein YigE (DUF2233 family)